ncbi:MAG: MCE family protein [Alphaproteobacteria bacterium]|nr:MCE family protein [Alphaproteobacteria bacterium]
MQSWTNELKVGVFVVVALAIAGFAFVWSFDGVRDDEALYRIHMTVESASGLYEGTAVQLAGVEIGSVEGIGLAGDRARVTLRIREAYQLPVDTTGELKATGLLGDYYVRLYPGVEDAFLQDGAVIPERSVPGDIDTVTRNLETISEDIAAITKLLREMVENRDNRDHVESTLANVDALTAELRYLAERNSADLDAIIDSVRRLSESLEGYTDDIAADVDEEMDKLKVLTDELTTSAENVSSITGKVDRGEGTLGALVNDRTTIDEINETVDQVGNALGSLFGLQPELYFITRFYGGTEPSDTTLFPFGNELAWSNSNTVGVNLRANNDFWWTFELVDHPQGTVTQREVYREATDTYEMRWIRERGFKFSFFVNKRWGPAAFRLGLKEDGGGVGVTFFAWRDRVEIAADLFSFRFGSYPAVAFSGVPNTRAYIRVHPARGFFVEVGAEQIALGIAAAAQGTGFFSGYIGGGFIFGDDRIRGVFTSLPSGALR